MSQWYSKEIGEGIEAASPRYQIQEAFVPLFAAAGGPLDMALFSRYDRDKEVVTVYFSPGASAFAKAFGAIPCEKPKKVEGFGLLAGNGHAFEFFYPPSQ